MEGGFVFLIFNRSSSKRFCDIFFIDQFNYFFVNYYNSYLNRKKGKDPPIKLNSRNKPGVSPEYPFRLSCCVP